MRLIEDPQYSLVGYQVYGFGPGSGFCGLWYEVMRSKLVVPGRSKGMVFGMRGFSFCRKEWERVVRVHHPLELLLWKGRGSFSVSGVGGSKFVVPREPVWVLWVGRE